MSQKKYSLLYPDTNAQYRTLSDVTMHDLGMDQICKKLSAKEREQNYIQKRDGAFVCRSGGDTVPLRYFRGCPSTEKNA